MKLPALKTWFALEGSSFPYPFASQKAALLNLLQLGDFQSPNKLNLGGCATKALHLEAAPRKLCTGFVT